MKALVRISLLLVIVLVSLSAYLRLANSGIGCADWPACYGRIGPPQTIGEAPSSRDAYSRIVEDSNEPMAWATPLHRLVASVLGLLIVALNWTALRRKEQRLASLSLLGLTVFLAVLGIRSGSLHNPGVVMGNLVGGFCMLGLLGWMWLNEERPYKGGNSSGRLRFLTLFATTALCLQILLGGLTSANFAATSCRSLPDCHGSWWPGSALAAALDLSREHEVTSSGQAIGGPERVAVHKAHRIGALLVVLLVLACAFSAWRTDPAYRSAVIIVTALAGAEFAVGVAAVISSLPIGLAVAHNWLSGLMLLAMLNLLALSR